MEKCTPVNLGGGTTPNNPCTTIGIDPFSVQWCTVVDFVRVRRATQLERNALVAHLLAFRDLLVAGKGSNTEKRPRIQSALALQLEVAKLLAEMPETAFQLAVSLNYTPTQATLLLAQYAERLHVATCDVASEIKALGAPAPSTPTPPKEPGGIKDAFIEWGETAVQVAGLVVGAGLLLVGGLWAANRITQQTQREAATSASARTPGPSTGRSGLDLDPRGP